MNKEEALVKQIAKWVAKRADKESIFLSASPEWNINARDLLDHISDITGISKEQIGHWTDEIAEKEKL